MQLRLTNPSVKLQIAHAEFEANPETYSHEEVAKILADSENL